MSFPSRTDYTDNTDNPGDDQDYDWTQELNSLFQNAEIQFQEDVAPPLQGEAIDTEETYEEYQADSPDDDSGRPPPAKRQRTAMHSNDGGDSVFHHPGEYTENLRPQVLDESWRRYKDWRDNLDSGLGDASTAPDFNPGINRQAAVPPPSTSTAHSRPGPGPNSQTVEHVPDTTCHAPTQPRSGPQLHTNNNRGFANPPAIPHNSADTATRRGRLLQSLFPGQSLPGVPVEEASIVADVFQDVTSGRPILPPPDQMGGMMARSNALVIELRIAIMIEFLRIGIRLIESRLVPHLREATDQGDSTRAADIVDSLLTNDSFAHLHSGDPSEDPTQANPIGVQDYFRQWTEACQEAVRSGRYRTDFLPVIGHTVRTYEDIIVIPQPRNEENLRDFLPKLVRENASSVTLHYVSRLNREMLLEIIGFFPAELTRLLVAPSGPRFPGCIVLKPGITVFSVAILRHAFMMRLPGSGMVHLVALKSDVDWYRITRLINEQHSWRIPIVNWLYDRTTDRFSIDLFLTDLLNTALQQSQPARRRLQSSYVGISIYNPYGHQGVIQVERDASPDLDHDGAKDNGDEGPRSVEEPRISSGKEIEREEEEEEEEEGEGEEEEEEEGEEEEEAGKGKRKGKGKGKEKEQSSGKGKGKAKATADGGHLVEEAHFGEHDRINLGSIQEQEAADMERAIDLSVDSYASENRQRRLASTSAHRSQQDFTTPLASGQFAGAFGSGHYQGVSSPASQGPTNVTNILTSIPSVHNAPAEGTTMMGTPPGNMYQHHQMPSFTASINPSSLSTGAVPNEVAGNASMYTASGSMIPAGFQYHAAATFSGMASVPPAQGVIPGAAGSGHSDPASMYSRYVSGAENTSMVYQQHQQSVAPPTNDPSQLPLPTIQLDSAPASNFRFFHGPDIRGWHPAPKGDNDNDGDTSK